MREIVSRIKTFCELISGSFSVIVWAHGTHEAPPATLLETDGSGCGLRSFCNRWAQRSSGGERLQRCQLDSAGLGDERSSVCVDGVRNERLRGRQCSRWQAEFRPISSPGGMVILGPRWVRA